MKNPYFWLMITDIVSGVIVDLMADYGVSEEDITKEDWEQMAPALRSRRKAAADRIRAHSQGGE